MSNSISLPDGLSVTPSYDESSNTITLVVAGLPCGADFVMTNLPSGTGFAVGIAPVNAVYNEIWVQTLPPCPVNS